MSEISSILLNWFEQHKRDLPWRHTKDPYKIWLSEIILQQTRVAQGMPYYLSFVENFPKVEQLAKASEEEVLRLWQGLGYYSRGRNLHFSAKQIVNEFDGKFPTNFNNIKKLKGVGNYTAAAIASFAFQEKVAAVDGNVIRVVSRLFGIEKGVYDVKTLKEIDELANAILPAKHHDLHNQAMMEFGALQCVPKKPSCLACPMQEKCVVFEKKMVDKIPFKSKKVTKRNRYFNYLIYRFNNKYYLKKRGPNDIWEGLYEFDLLETKEAESTQEILKNTQFEKFKFIKEIEVKKHVLSHQNIFTKFIEIELFEEPKQLKMFTVSEIKKLPKSILMDNFLEKNIF